MQFINFFLKSVLAALLLFLLTGIVAFAILQTKPAQTWLLQQLISYVEKETGTTIQIKQINFVFPLSLQLKEVTILEQESPLLTIGELKLSSSYIPLLKERLECPKIQLADVKILQLPSKRNGPSAPLKWQEVWQSYYTNIKQLFISNLLVDLKVVKQLALPTELEDFIGNSQFCLKGNVLCKPKKGTTLLNLLVSVEDKQAKSSSFELKLRVNDQKLHLALESRSFPLPLRENSLKFLSSFWIETEAPLETWQRALESSRLPSLIEGSYQLALDLPTDQGLHKSLQSRVTTVKGRFSLENFSKLTFDDLLVENPFLTLKGSLILNEEQEIENAHFYGTLDSFNFFNLEDTPSIEEPLLLEANLSGNLSHPLLTLVGTTPRLAFKQELFKQLRSTLICRYNKQQLAGEFTFQFENQNKFHKGSTFFKWKAPQLYLTDMTFKTDDLKLKASLSTSIEDQLWEGEIKGEGELDRLAPFLPFPIKGLAKLSLDLSVSLLADQKKAQEFKGFVEGENLTFSNWHVALFRSTFQGTPADHKDLPLLNIETTVEATGLRSASKSIEFLALDSHYLSNLAHTHLEDLKIKGAVQELVSENARCDSLAFHTQFPYPLQGSSGNFFFQVNNLANDSVKLHQLTAESHLDNSLYHSTFKIKGVGGEFDKEKWEFETVGDWKKFSTGLEIQIDRLQGYLGNHPLQLVKPVFFSHFPDRLNLSPLHLKWGQAELEASLASDFNQIKSDFRTNQIPLEFFRFVLPELPLKGKATCKGEVNGSWKNPTSEIQIQLHQVQFLEEIFRNRPLLQVEFNLKLENKQIAFDATVNGIGHTPILAKGFVPVVKGPSFFTYHFNEELPFSLTLNAAGELDPYLHLFYNDTTNLSGQTNIAIGLSGLLKKPTIQGTIDLYDASYESLSTGALYKNIQIKLEGEGSKIKLTHFSAQDDKQGMISATGEIEINRHKHFPFIFYIQPKEIFILESDYARLAASGRLKLTGNKQKALLSGQLVVDSGLIQMEEARPAQIKTVEFKLVNLPKGTNPTLESEKMAEQESLSFDVLIDLPGSLKAEGKHLKSEWKGEVALGGTLQNPLLNGDLHVVKGEYDFNGKDFNLTQGHIHFAGAPNKKTSLYMVAGKNIDKIYAEIIAKGSITRPVISFRSTPPLSQREILSYILFNRGIADITRDQGDQLSHSFITINQNEQTPDSDDLLSRLRNNIGIDRLDITSSEEDSQDLSLQIGKYITDNIFISINKRIIDIGNRVAIEVNLMKNLKAEAEVELEGYTQGKFSLKWKKDY